MAILASSPPRSPTRRAPPTPKFNPTDQQLSMEVFYDAFQKVLQDAKRQIDMGPYGTEARLMNNGFLRDKEIYEKGHQALQVLNSACKLQLPIKTSEDKSGAGLSIETFLKDNCKGDLPSREEMLQLVPEVETKISQQTAWLAQILQTADIDSLVVEAGIQMKSLNASQQQYRTTVGALADESIQLLESLLSFSRQQAEFLQSIKMDEQREMDMLLNEAAEGTAQACLLKAEITEARVLSFNYSRESIDALKKVAGHLTTAEKDADEKIHQLTARIQEYEDLGPEFKDLAKAYRKLNADLAHSSNELRELQEEATIAQYTP